MPAETTWIGPLVDRRGFADRGGLFGVSFA
jgi:hypothetical protein